MVVNLTQSREKLEFAKSVPPLENGDRLTRAEFERRYEASPQIKNAELIEGVVYVAAALRFDNHARPHANLMGWLFLYKTFTAPLQLADNPTVRLDRNNNPQPDGAMFLTVGQGGQVRVSADDYLEGAPELIVEVAASSAAYDLGDKKAAYLRNGVQEYIVWQMHENQLDWFCLEEDEYISQKPDEDGVIRSRIFPGLWLAVEALLSDDMPQVVAVVQQGLASPEHQAFVQALTAQN